MDRNLIRQELETVRVAAGGILLPADIVAAARNPNSALHPHFEWDDTAAADAYRLEQARSLIKIVVVPVTMGTETVIVPFYQVSTNGHGYESVIVLMSDDDKHKELVLSALGRARDGLRNVPDDTCQKVADKIDKEIQKVSKWP
jgi:hypothetical protein